MARGVVVPHTTAKRAGRYTLHPNENGRLEGGRDRTELRQLGAGAQMKFCHTQREVHSDRSGYRDRLQCDRIAGTADENVGAETRGDRDLTCRTEIVTGEKGRARRRDAIREHRPHHNPAAGGADIQPELADRAVVDLLRSRRLRRERAGDLLLRADDEAHAG